MTYEYNARAVRVIDGDTIELRADVGFHTYVQKKFRLLGVDTPELRGGTAESKERARKAKDFVEQIVANRPLIIRTEKPDSFGRWLARVFIVYQAKDGPVHDALEDLSQLLIDEGHGVPYKKAKR